jgi:two-component system, NtrC family, response regulator AtoC
MTQENRTLDALDFGASPPAQEVFLLVQVDGQSRTLSLPEGAAITVGRSRASTVFVDDERVSRRHASFERRGADVVVVDLGSRNGTQVAGQRIEGERRLQAGETVTIGPMLAVLAIAVRPAPAALDGPGGDPCVIANPAMARVYELCRKVAGTPLSVLVSGETGVGKERVAEAIHGFSPRAGRPFVRLHMAALPESLLESELFGHERGAFSGADRRHVGYFESASGGTLFLDEIGELPAATQTKLLRALETKRVARLGSTSEIEVDIRVVAATNRDLAGETRAGRFREDLFFRLSAFRIQVPPLRERRDEIQLLAALFAREMSRTLGVATPALAPEALAVLLRYGWPGNVRELKHVIEAACVMAAPGEIRPEHLAESVTEAVPASVPRVTGSSERDELVAALEANAGNQTRAALQLGISRRTLIYRMRKHDLRAVKTIE